MVYMLTFGGILMVNVNIYSIHGSYDYTCTNDIINSLMIYH